MKLNRIGVSAGLLAAAVLLAACGSDTNSTSSSSTPAGGGASSASASPSPTYPAVTCASGTLNSDGSTAQANAMSQWIKDYQTKCAGTTVNYSGGGSGQGVTDFNGGKVDFAGSDSALSAAKGEVAAAATRCGSPALDLPMVVGPVAIAYKLSGVNKLILNGSVLTQMLARQDHDLEQRRDHQVEPRCDAPVHPDHGVLPVRPVRYHAERRDLPAGRRPDRLHRHAEQGVGRHGRSGQVGLAGRPAGRRGHRGRARVRRILLRGQRKPADGQHRQRLRPGRSVPRNGQCRCRCRNRRGHRRRPVAQARLRDQAPRARTRSSS